MIREKELSVSIIIPMHNEEENVERIIHSSENILSQIAVDWEIIVVESGSTDNTWKKISESVSSGKRIRAFRQDKKEGMGSALRLGYSKSTKDLICHLEADSPFEMVNFKKAIPILLENDCVIGYRVGKKMQNYKWSYYNMNKLGTLLRAVFHVGYNLLLRAIFGLIVRDVNFSFKIFKRKHIQSMDLISNGWFIDAEILLKLKKRGILPIEMPVEYIDRTKGKSTVSILDPISMFYEIARYIRHTGRKAKEEKRHA